MSAYEGAERRGGAGDALAGLLAGASLVLSALGMGAGLLLEIDAHPARVIPAAVVLAIVSGRMSARHERLARFAIFFAMVAFPVGMTLAVLTENRLV
jgi:mannose/fructose/N-acetylgalactosamine-specific phosphotransferase system component IIC